MNKIRIPLIYRHNWLLLLYCSIAFTLAGCENETKYYRYCPTSKEGWLRQDTLRFPFPEDLPNGIYEIEIGLRNENEYRYRDIWLSVSQNIQDSLQYKTDTFHIYLADETGKWHDGDNIGNLHQHVFNSGKIYNITQSHRKCSFKIAHIMSDNPLKGIRDLGIRLIKKQ